MYTRFREAKPESKDPYSQQFHSRSADYKAEHKDEEKNTKEKFKEK